MIIEKEGFLFEEYSNSVKVVGLNMKLIGDLVIPDKINGKPVTIIASNVFKGLTKLKSVALPDCIDVIDISAFADCGNLKRFVVYRTNPNHATKMIEVNQFAFSNCYQLEYFSSSIPLFLDMGVFDGCKRLKNLNAVVAHCGMKTFNKCDSLLEIAFAENARWLHNSFENCNNLQSLLFNGKISNTVLKNNQAMSAVKDKTLICTSNFPHLDLVYDGFKIKIV